MLSKDEEELLDKRLAEMKHLQAHKHYHWMTGGAYLWLAKKLKETNDELKSVSKERDTLQLQYMQPERSSVEELTKPQNCKHSESRREIFPDYAGAGLNGFQESCATCGVELAFYIKKVY